MLFLSGRAVSELFSSIFNFGISLYILEATQSGLPFAISLVCGSIPKIIFSYIAGSISDKTDRKRMIVICDLLSCCVLFIFLGIFKIFNSIMLIYAVNAVLSSVSVFFSVAINGMIPNIINDKELLSKVNAKSQTVSSLASLLGPIIGGILYENLNLFVFIILNAVSFLVSGISEMFIVVTNAQESKSSNDNISTNSDVKHFLKKRTDIYRLIISCSCVNFFLAFGFTVPMPFIVNNVYKYTAVEFGVLKSALVTGSLFASFVFSIKKTKGNIQDVYYKSIAGLGGVYVLFSLSYYVTSNYRIIILFFLFMMSSALMVSINVPLKTMLQKEIPNEIIGRVFGILNIYLSIASPFGNVISGLLIDRINSLIIPLFSGVTLLVIVLIFNVRREGKKYV